MKKLRVAAGIDTIGIKIKAYLIEGGLVGLAATLLASRLKSAAPALGQGYDLDAIAGAIVGGVSFSGGIGSVWGMVLGAVIIGVINNGMDLLGVQAFYKQIVRRYHYSCSSAGQKEKGRPGLTRCRLRGTFPVHWCLFWPYPLDLVATTFIPVPKHQ